MSTFGEGSHVGVRNGWRPTATRNGSDFEIVGKTEVLLKT